MGGSRTPGPQPLQIQGWSKRLGYTAIHEATRGWKYIDQVSTLKMAPVSWLSVTTAYCLLAAPSALGVNVTDKLSCLRGQDTVTLQTANAAVNNATFYGVWAFLPVTEPARQDKPHNIEMEKMLNAQPTRPTPRNPPALLLKHALQPLEQHIRMMPLEDQHGPQPDRLSATPTHINAPLLRLPQHLIPPRRIPRNKRALPLPPQILNLPWIPLAQALQAREKIVTRGGCVRDEVQTLNLPDNRAEQQRARRVAHPRVELAKT
ncbi:hypothetical protein OPT61_g9153 [Boeremia exigua]|uniref:Uncharacterized protein n=1 Tax=Boeremia exigua TaxID=749465 RepID=A0ACC2HW37_9PLEO|nr:hypothetical protein OPT61_g9153 [Boeremia exigua]